MSNRWERRLLQLRERITFCTECHTFTDQEVCGICRDAATGPPCYLRGGGAGGPAGHGRERGLPGGVPRTHGVISPLEGVGPEQLKIDSLMRRARSEEMTEIIMATNPTVEGEATANYLYDRLKDLSVAGEPELRRVFRWAAT